MPGTRRLLATGLAVVALGAVGCGEENRRMLPEQDAQALLGTLDELGSAIDQGECEAAAQRLQEARQQVDELPGAVAESLRDRLEQGMDHLEGRLPQDCAAAVETPTPTPTPELTPSPTPVETPPPTPVPEEEEEEEEEPPEEQPEKGGGVPGGGEGDQRGNGNQG